MRAPLEICRKRSAVAILASGVVISLTAMTGGIAPAFADPRTDPVTPTTTVVPVPEPETAPETQTPQKAPEKTTEKAPESQAPPSTAAQPTAPAVAATTAQAPPSQAAQTPAEAPASSTAQPSASIAPKPTPSATAVEPPATSAEPPAPRVARQAPVEQEPTTSTGKSPTSTAPAPESSSPAPAPATESAAPAPALVAPGAASPASTSSGTPSASSTASQRPEAEASSTEDTTGARSPASSSVSQAAKVIEAVAPETLQAPQQDVVLAKSAKVVEQDPVPAPKQEVADLARVLDVQGRDPINANLTRRDDAVFSGGDRRWDRNVRQWDPNWVEYDDYYRPVISNPYRDPVKIIYVYQNAPRIVYIPPLARIVLDVAQFAAYSFTAIVLSPVALAANLIDTAVNVAVGSFFGGGYFPGIGLPLPPPPPPLFRYDNVPVQVRYSDRVYEPFRVQRIVDVGDDAQYGERKVLLDGVTPAWGEWTQTATGERQFEVHRTQQYPGLDEPREAPLPGDYRLQLASDQSSTGMSRRDVYLMATAVLLAALSLGAVGWAVLLGRRRTQH